MSPANALSRYKPAVLAIASVAAACGVYMIYTATSRQQHATGLRRSNAVHRRRPRPDVHDHMTDVWVGWVTPGPQCPCGRIILARSGYTEFSRSLGVEHIPTEHELQARLGLNSDASAMLLEEIQPLAVKLIITALFRDIDVLERVRVSSNVAHDIPQFRHVISVRDPHGVTSLAPILSDVLGIEWRPALNDVLLSIMEGNLFSQRESEEEVVLEGQAGIDADSNTAGVNDDEERSQGLKGLLYYIAEEQAHHAAYVHHGISCDECGIFPIRGARWRCLNCDSFDLCSACEQHTPHQKTHVFVKVKIPIPLLSQSTVSQPTWYPGSLRRGDCRLPADLRNRLHQSHKVAAVQVDAFFDQFSCLANVVWDSDPDGIRAAIDRQGFQKAMSSERWPAPLAPNVVYDRTFAFYDTDQNGFIGFAEFMDGLQYLRGPNRFASLRRSLQGYDIDCDGFVNREDFIRMFRAKYAIQRQLVHDMVDGHEAQVIPNAMNVVRSSQPISAAFRDADIPNGETRRPTGKSLDHLGDLQPDEDTTAVLDKDDRASRLEARTSRNRHAARLDLGNDETESRADLRSRFTRLDDMVFGNGDSTAASAASDRPSYQSTVNDEGEEGVAFTDDEMARLGLLHIDMPQPESDLGTDILYHVVEKGFHEMLDPIFATSEGIAKEVECTTKDRRLLKHILDKGVRLLVAQHEVLESGSDVDPLLAIAVSAGQTQPVSVMDSPLDLPEDLRRIVDAREDSANKFPDYLRQPQVYYTRHQTDNQWKMIEEAQARKGTVFFSTSSNDPTFPHRRPSSPSSPAPTRTREILTLRPDYVAKLTVLEAEARVMQRSGGPGRLSYEYVEQLVDADRTGGLKGLINSWLDYASF